jgi:hypothetical protein
MTDISKTLPNALTNLTRNREQVEINRKKVQQAISQLDDASTASIKQLLAKFEHAQAVTQFVNAFVQLEALNGAAGDIDALIAVVQIALDDDSVSAQAQAQLAANEGALNAPLPSAGQTVASAPVDQTAAQSPASDASQASA